MDTGRRARADQVAGRINAAVELLSMGLGIADAARTLAGRYNLSERQARRYVDRARGGGHVPVPLDKTVLTIRVPAILVGRVRRVARATGQSISALVSQALSEFLDRHYPGGGHG